MSLLTQTPGATILDNLGDVIEGGTTYRGSGTAWPGIPGMHSQHELAGTTITASSGDDDRLISATLGDTAAASLVRTDTPPFFLRATSGTALNIGVARRITSFDTSFNMYFTGTWPAVIEADDTFIVEEGFKRSPNRFALRDEPATAGFDRFFHLSLLPGKQLDWRGDGTQMWESELVLRLRLVKRRTDRDLVESCMDNLARIRSVLPNQSHRDALTMGLWASEHEPDVETDTPDHVLLKDTYRIRYRIDSEFR